MPSTVCPEPLVIHPPADLPNRHPQLRSLAKQLAIQYAHRELVTDEDLKTVGGQLWQALDSDDALRQCRDQAGMLILPLIIESDDPALQALPWECLYHPSEGFLAKHDHFTLSRRFPALGGASAPLQKGPLKVLLFTSQPADIDPETARLNTEDERAAVLEALTPWIQQGQVALEAPDDGRFSALKEHLRAGCQIVFLSGHGVFHHEQVSEKPPYGVFWFESETGASEPIKGEDLAAAFVGSHVQCVVLSACQSGQAASDDLNAGLARQLLRVGLPHVVGMRESILDRAGILFARAFCDAIGGQERVDTALQKARRAITRPLRDATYRDGNADGLAELSLGQWCLPMLLSRDAGQALIDWDFALAPPDEFLHSDALEQIELPEVFIGRRRELRELGGPLQRGARRRLLITGAGGQGKTALTGQLALGLQTRGFQVHAYSARPENNWKNFIIDLQIALDTNHTEEFNAKAKLCTTPEREARVLLDLVLKQNQGRVVIFFDNLESVQNPDNREITDENINAWLGTIQGMGGKGPVLLLTSRWSLPGWPEADHHELTRPDYGDFLRYVQQVELPPQIGRERLRTLYETLGGNFRGLQFFLKAAPEMSAAEDEAFLARLGKAKQELQTNMAIEKVVGFLEPDKRTLLERLPVYTAPVPVDGIKKIGLDLPQPAALLQRLVDFSLVDVEYAHDIKARQYQCGPQVADWLRSNGAKTPDPNTYRLAAEYQIYLFETDRRSLQQALNAHQALQSAQLTEQANQFVLDHLLGYFDRRGLYRTMLEVWLPPLRESTGRKLKADALNWSGNTSFHIGDYNTAFEYLNRSLAIRQEIGDKHGEGSTLDSISQIYNLRGDYDTALEYSQRSLVITQEIGDKGGEGSTLNSISQIYHNRGDYAAAVDYLERSLKIQEEIGDRQGEGATLNNISALYHDRGDYDTAFRYLKRSLAIRQEIGDRQGESATLNNISQIYNVRGDYDTALEYLKRSLMITREIGHRQGESVTLDNIAQIYDFRGDYDTALEYLKRSLAIRQEIGDKRGEGSTLNNISGIFRARGDYDTALEYLVRSLTAQQKIGYRRGESATLNNISQIYDARGDYDTALKYLERSLAITQETGDRRGEGATLNNISQIYDARGDYDTALKYLERSLAVQQEIGHLAGLCTTLFNISLIHLRNAKIQESESALVTAYRIAKQIGYAQVLEALDDLGKQFGGPGLEFWEQLAKKMDS